MAGLAHRTRLTSSDGFGLQSAIKLVWKIKESLAQTINQTMTSPHSTKIYFSQDIMAAIRNSATDSQLVGASC